MTRPDGDPRFEDYPLTRPEYISALVHLYRGELARANLWRARLDTTTNWAVLTAMGLLSYAFGSTGSSHASLLVGMVMVVHFLLLEARRYRVCDVWNSRLRMIEENFYGPILTRDLASPRGHWGELVAADLLHPCYKITYLEAVRARLIRNYGALLGLLLAAWLVKIWIRAEGPLGADTALDNAAFGPVPGLAVLALVALLYGAALAVLLFVRRVDHPESAWSGRPEMEVDEHL